MYTIGTLPISVPYLEPHGANWAIFMMRFRDTMKAVRRWAYFTGEEPCPEGMGASKATSAEQGAIEAWEYEDSVASYLLYQRLPDAIVMRLSVCSTTHERWEKITREFQAKSAYAQADLHEAFLEMHCAKGEEVRDFLASLCCKREELAAAGVLISEKEYERTILRGIPSELATFASHLLSSALIVHGATSIDLDALVNQICEEADRLKSQRTRSQPSEGRKSKPETEVFMAAEPGGRRRRRGKCHKCGEEGHWARECCTPTEGNATAPAAQASLGATAPPKTQHVGEAHTVLDIAITRESWLAEEEEVAHAQIVDAETDLPWGHLEDSVVDAHAQFVSAEPDPLVGEPESLEDDAHAHLESAEPEILMNVEDDWLQEVEEEGTAKVMAAVDDTRVDLQRFGVSQPTTLKKASILTLPLSQSPHQPVLLRTERPPRSPATETGMRATRESRRRTNLAPPPLDRPPANGAAKPPDNTVPEQIQAPTQVERPSESLWGKKTWRATGQDSQASARTLEGMTPLGTAHERPPDPAGLYAQGSTVLEQRPIDPKALVRIIQTRRPVVDEGADAHIDPWPDPGTVHSNLDAYFKVSALLEGEQKLILPSADSEQAVTPKTFSISCLLPPPDTLEREGVEPERHDAAQRPARLTLPEQVAKDPDKAGGVWLKSAPAVLTCPQLATKVEMGDIEAPNTGMVEAKRKAEWPAQGLATERECGRDQSPPEAPYERDPKVLRGTGACKPEDESATLKSAAPGHLETKPRHKEGGLALEDLLGSQGPHFEATEPRARTSSTAEKENPYTDEKQVNMAGIDYTDAHAPSFSLPFDLGHSCSAYSHSFQARLQGRRHCRQRWSWSRQGLRGRAASHMSPSRTSHANLCARSSMHNHAFTAPSIHAKHFASVPNYA
jgi:hypothetical protein